MSKNLYIDASHPNETRVVLKNNNHIEDYEYESINNTLIKNNIYLGKVSRIEPSLQAAFVDFGRERHGFLSFNDIQSDYYQIPKADLEKMNPEFKKSSTLFHSKAEVEGLYKSLSRFAGAYGLVISKIEKEKEKPKEQYLKPTVVENKQEIKYVFQLQDTSYTKDLVYVENDIVKSALENQQFITESKKWAILKKTIYGLSDELNLYWEMDENVLTNKWIHKIERRSNK